MENFAKMGFLASRTGGQPRIHNLGQNKWNIWTTPLFLFVLSKIIKRRETFFSIETHSFAQGVTHGKERYVLIGQLHP